jgi:hypothetical protein
MGGCAVQTAEHKRRRSLRNRKKEIAELSLKFITSYS